MQRQAVEIQMLGKFEIRVKGKPVLTQLKNAVKTMNLIQYLLLKQTPVTHAELIEALWSESESSNPSSALRTMLHRFRMQLEECGITELRNCVLTGHGTCQWNPDLDCSVDIVQMDRLVSEAEEKINQPEKAISKYLQVMELYAGPLLPDLAEELWVMPKNVYYHDLYLSSVLQLVALYKEQEDYASVLQVCRQAMDVEPYDERLHVELMLALVKTGKNREALSQYYYVSDLQYKQFGAQPSQEIRSLYKQIVQADQQMETDIENIQNAIEEEDATEGAFVCEYEIFKDIYQLQWRMLERYSSTMFIGLFTLRDPYRENFDPLLLDSIMREFLELTRHMLRRGDTISRYSATQYVVLLPAVNHESGNQIMDRIKRAFYAAYIKSSVMLTYKLRPLHVAGGKKKKR